MDSIIPLSSQDGGLRHSERDPLDSQGSTFSGGDVIKNPDGDDAVLRTSVMKKIL